MSSRALDHPFNSVKTQLQSLHLRTIAEPHKVVAGAIEEVATLGRVEVEEDTRDDNGLFVEQGVEESEAVADVDGRVLGNGRVECGQVQPDIKGGLGPGLVSLSEADIAESLEDIVALLLGS